LLLVRKLNHYTKLNHHTRRTQKCRGRGVSM
jgi:hypothetical protein